MRKTRMAVKLENKVGVKHDWHKRKEPEKKSVFSVIFTSVVGGGSLGSAFGVPGMILGAAIGGGIGAYVSHTHA